MTTKTQHNLLSFDRPFGKSKTWSLGWSTTSVRTGERSGGNTQGSQSPGFYGALVTTERR